MNCLQQQPVWLLLAVASGACAAFNGVFAKLTTTDLTSSWSSALSTFFSLAPENQVINYLLRGLFFGLNLVFNVAMWSLFTAALTRAASTTRVSIVNVSSNFVVTALLGLVIFGEELPATWWLGAAFLAGGNVVIGSRDGEEKKKKTKTKAVNGEEPGANAAEGASLMRDGTGEEDDADMIDLDGDIVLDESIASREARKKGDEVDELLK